jgi:hypothetical protein
MCCDHELSSLVDLAKVFKAVLRIHDILVWIRRSMPLTDGSGSCYFVIDLQDANKKTNLKKVFLLITFRRYIYIIF